MSACSLGAVRETHFLLLEAVSLGREVRPPKPVGPLLRGRHELHTFSPQRVFNGVTMNTQG